MFPGSHDNFIHMLTNMLQANPNKIISASEALKDSIFDDFREEHLECSCETPLSADFESICESTENLKQNVCIFILLLYHIII